jgi:hypothetical protein
LLQFTASFFFSQQRLLVLRKFAPQHVGSSLYCLLLNLGRFSRHFFDLIFSSLLIGHVDSSFGLHCIRCELLLHFDLLRELARCSLYFGRHHERSSRYCLSSKLLFFIECRIVAVLRRW